MMKTVRISSVQNPIIKRALLLKEKSRERKKSGLFVLEGIRELQLALRGGIVLETFFYCPEIIRQEILDSLGLHQFSALKKIEVSKEVYQKLAHRETTEGIFAIGKSKTHTLDQLIFKRKRPLILIAQAPEKPGNIGALLRTADAADLDAVIIADPKTDLYNPNIIRSSVGCVFTTPIALGSSAHIIRFLQENQIAIYGAALSASKHYVEVDFKCACAIVLGTEATGLSPEWLEKSDQNIIIPMLGEIDSMNVSVSAAILIFEAKRQRDFS
ncbi:TrmH family RNA methyltransferase [Spongiimicrobium sp. 2-473A-2-J]|uniref:TrmH family RNA methyltransferase n=1 Tax=Eudoraea algarum TaxID=3417568 RepID=UPI003D36012B